MKGRAIEDGHSAEPLQPGLAEHRPLGRRPRNAPRCHNAPLWVAAHEPNGNCFPQLGVVDTAPNDQESCVWDRAYADPGEILIVHDETAASGSDSATPSKDGRIAHSWMSRPPFTSSRSKDGRVERLAGPDADLAVRRRQWVARFAPLTLGLVSRSVGSLRRGGSLTPLRSRRPSPLGGVRPRTRGAGCASRDPRLGFRGRRLPHPGLVSDQSLYLDRYPYQLLCH